MLKYFWTSDDDQLAGQWQDSHFDEDGSWWANVQQSGAFFALASTLVLAAASVAVATGVFSQSQDDPAGSLFTVQFSQEDYWQNPTPPVNWPQPSAFTDDDVHPTFVQTFTPDDGDQWRQLVPPDLAGNNRLSLPFLDPEEIPVGSFPPLSNPEDEGGIGWSPLQVIWDPYWNLLFFLDDGSTVPVFMPDEDFWTPQVAAQNWPQPQQPFSISDEDSLIPEFVTEDVVWLQLVAPDPGGLLWPQPWQFEQNESPTLAGFAEEFYWQNAVVPLADSLVWPQPFAFEQHDATGNLSIGVDDSFQPLLVFPTPDSLLTLQQFLFEEGDIFPSAPFADETYWQNPTATVVDSLLWPQPFVFEQTDATGSLASVIDEVYAPSLVFSDPSSLRLFQQFAQIQDDPAGNLYVLVDEYYWQNPVPPVNWLQPSVLVSDELIVPQSVATIDELYFAQFVAPWVAPVPAGMYVNLPYVPDPEEIPAGSLFQPVPPPPPKPCTPPAGPDGDTTYSYFGGLNPTAVLLCRICNSGRPLLVRGDYAIWCQDCCAFVSRQDTVMSTTRAPSTFRGRF